MSLCLPPPFVTFLQRLIQAISTTKSYLFIRHFQAGPTSESNNLESGWPPFLTRIWAWDIFTPRAGARELSINSEEKRTDPPDPLPSREDSPIRRLMNNPTLFDPIRKPRHPIVLCHGLYGFDVVGPSSFPTLQRHYWKDVLRILRHKVGAEVVVTGVPSTGSIYERANKLNVYLKDVVKGQKINFIAHSMGGLDCRHLISHVRPDAYTPVSLTTISTPHRGSPFMDWCTANLGIGGGNGDSTPTHMPPPTLPLPSALISLLDEPAYSNLSTTFLRDHFNPSTPDSPSVRYFSVAARTSKMSFFHPLWLPKLVLDSYEEKFRESVLSAKSDGSLAEPGNDGLVTVTSAKWGEFLGTVDNCDHWGIRGAGGFQAYFDHWNMPLGTDDEDGWSWKDWSSFLGVWRDKGQAQQADERAHKDKVQSKAKIVELTPSTTTAVGKDFVGMSAMLDWVSEHIPISPIASDIHLPPRSVPEAPRFDLEKFYVALSRKLYDEGL